MKYSLLIDKYLEGTLTEKEISELEQELVNNPDFAVDFELIKSLHSTILKYQKKKISLKESDTQITDSQELDLEEINAIIAKYSSKNFESLDERESEFKSILQNTIEKRSKYIEISNNPPKTRIIKYWWIVAGIASIIIICCLILKDSDKPTQESLFSEYYKPYYYSGITRGQGSYDELIDSALLSYSEGNYSSALHYLSAIPDSLSSTSSLFFMGQSYMALKEYDQAISELNKCTDNRIFSDLSNWYIALCYLKIGDPDSSKSILSEIVERDSYYSPDALSLLKKLEKLGD